MALEAKPSVRLKGKALRGVIRWMGGTDSEAPCTKGSTGLNTGLLQGLGGRFPRHSSCWGKY